jgi:hypothetical protein
MITTNLTGNLGNHMWQYAVCRSIAEIKGFDWGINPTPSHDYYNGQNQMYFMDVDFGKMVENIQHEFHEHRTIIHHYDIVDITQIDKRIYDIEDNTILIGFNGEKGGHYQCEDYLIEKKDDIKKWFNINEKYVAAYEKELRDRNIILDENLCVINFRGGEYSGISTLILRKEYWRDSINKMKEMNPNIKFLAVTDDIETCKKYMPYEIETIHIDIGFDFFVVNRAKFLIISNSSFGWWAAWLNSNAAKIIAPKYWARHNVSNGYWSLGNAYTKDFEYMDRNGSLLDYDTCKKEAEEFYTQNNLI